MPDSSPVSPTQTQIQAKKELARRELARRRLIDFIKYNFSGYDVNWHHSVIADKLEQVEAGKITRLMLFLPPRHGKSELGSVQFPAWFLGKNPKKEIICCSYTSDLAVDFGRRVRNLVDSIEYKNIFGVSLSEDSQAANKWNTSDGGSYVAVGVGGPITGRGADILIIDDPFKNRKEADSPLLREQVWKWYLSTAFTRLSPGGSVILICTRWHDDDLAGRLLSQKMGDKWEVVEFPALAIQDERIGDKFIRKTGEALWPTRYSKEKLEQMRNVLGTYEFASLYQQSPIDEYSQEFKKEWFKYRPESEVAKLDTRRFLTVDTAGPMTSRSDYTGLVDNRVDREGNWNIKASKYKINSADLVEMLFVLHDRYHYEKIGIEKTIYLDALKPFLDMEILKRNKNLPIYDKTLLKHGGFSKELRIRGLVPRYQAGKIFHIIDECHELEPQLLRFPKGREDDIVDALAYQDQIAETPFGDTTGEYEKDVKNRSKNFDKFSPFGEI
jgi:hypothetical protein